MNQQAITGLFLAFGLILFGSITALLQWRGRRRLFARKLVPSDELKYFRARYRRRAITGVLLTLIGCMIGGAYLSGMERRADDLSEPKRDPDQDPEAAKVPIPEKDKQFVRFWGGYWIAVLILVFTVIGMAFADAWATRRYWLAQYQQIREDHQTKLRRDLAVYRQQKEQSRAGNRLGGSSETDAE